MSGVLLGNADVRTAIRRVALKASRRSELRRLGVDEIEQEVLIQVWRAEKWYDPTRSPEKYAVTVAWRKVASMIRRAHTQKAVTDRASPLHGGESLDAERRRRGFVNGGPAAHIADVLDTEAILARIRSNGIDPREVLRIAEQRLKRSRRARAQRSENGRASG